MANELKNFLLKFAKDESTDYSKGGMNAKQVEILQDIVGRILDDQVMLYGINQTANLFSQTIHAFKEYLSPISGLP
jgi:hypothetical protein